MHWKVILVLLIAIMSACAPDFQLEKSDDFGPPTARLRVSPAMGDSTTWFDFNASHSRDADNLFGTLTYRWDLDNDGLWDTPYTINSDWVHVFPLPGFYTIKVEVKDRYEQTSITSVQIESYGVLPEGSLLTDNRDGQVYKTVRIGNVLWMAENLNYGNMILVTDTVREDSIVEKYCYLNDSTAKAKEGGYYTYYDWMEVMNHDTISVRGICPEGWELPSNDDWQLVLDYHGRPLKYFTEGGNSNMNLTVMGFPVRWHSWNHFASLSSQLEWTYFTRSFYRGYLFGPDKIIPFIISSEDNRIRGHIYTINYSNPEIREFRGITPVRCIKRD